MRRLPYLIILILIAIAGTAACASLSWSLVQIPGFIHHDSRYPGTAWEDAYSVVLNSIKAENPDIVLFTGIGDFIFGRWPLKESIEYYTDKYYPEWAERLNSHGLTYYVTPGAFEMGGFPWNAEKQLQLARYQSTFASYLQMPSNGPADQSGIAFVKRIRNILILSLNLMERVNEQCRPEMSEKQLDWLKKTLNQHTDVDHAIVTGYFPLTQSPSATQLTSLPGLAYPKLFQTLKDRGIALYLHGDSAGVSIQNKEGLCQLSPGGMFGWTPTVNYTLIRVQPEILHVEVKSLPVTCSHHSEGSQQLFPKTIAFDKEQVAMGFRTTGSVDFMKQDGSYRLKHKTGCFHERSR